MQPVQWIMESEAPDASLLRAQRQLEQLDFLKQTTNPPLVYKLWTDGVIYCEFILSDYMRRVRVWGGEAAKLIFHVYADNTNYGLYRQNGKWKKKAFAVQNKHPWGYRHTWISADKKHALMHGKKDYFGRVFSDGPAANILGITYLRPGVMTGNFGSEYQSSSPNVTVHNGERLTENIDALTTLDDGTLVSLYFTYNVAESVTAEVLRLRFFPDTGPQVYVPLVPQIEACFSYVHPDYGVQPVDGYKISPDGKTIVAQFHNGATITEEGNPYRVQIKNFKFTLNLTGITDLASVTAGNITVEDLGDIYSVVEHTPTVEDYALDYYDGYYGWLTTTHYDRTMTYTAYDIGMDGNLIEVKVNRKEILSRQMMTFGQKTEGATDPNGPEWAPGATWTGINFDYLDSEYNMWIAVDGVEVFRSTPSVQNVSKAGTQSEEFHHDYDPTTIYFSYGGSASGTHDCYEIFDFDPRRKTLGLIGYRETYSSSGSGAWSETYGPYEDPYYLHNGSTSVEMTAGPSSTTATEYIVVDGVEVSSTAKVGVGTEEIPAEGGRGRSEAKVHYNLDRAAQAVRSAFSSEGDMLVLSHKLEGIHELDGVNFPTAWVDDGKPTFFWLKDRTGTIIDLTKFGFTEVMRIGLCEGYKE